jgi:hypothetical protein
MPTYRLLLTPSDALHDQALASGLFDTFRCGGCGPGNGGKPRRMQSPHWAVKPAFGPVLTAKFENDAAADAALSGALSYVAAGSLVIPVEAEAASAEHPARNSLIVALFSAAPPPGVPIGVQFCGGCPPGQPLVPQWVNSASAVQASTFIQGPHISAVVLRFESADEADSWLLLNDSQRYLNGSIYHRVDLPS